MLNYLTHEFKINDNMDTISLERIKLLHPRRRAEAEGILEDITCLVDTPSSFCRFAFTLRSFAEQQAIYDQGRTTPGKKVTNAKPGQSMHNYGLAIDIVFIIDGKTASWDMTKDWDRDATQDWTEVVRIFKGYGWSWGGDWTTFKDYPHFQKTEGYKWEKLLELHNNGRVDSQGYVLL